MAERTKTAAKQAERLALLAHDLRTPLAAMKLTAELIARDGLSAQQAERLEILVRSIDALDDLAGELLRKPGQADGSHEAAADLTAIVSETSQLFEAAARAKGLRFTLSLPETPLAVELRKAAPLRRIVGALLDNAVKYTDTGSIGVTLEAARSGDGAQARIAVTDTGPGIDGAEQQRLFKPYARGKAGRARASGSGLGLWGAVQLAEEIGGGLQLLPGDPSGCRFEVSLPLPALQAVPSLPVEKAGLPGAGAGVHVLIVDDNDTNRRLLAALLEAFSVTSDQAAGGEEALGMVREGSYDAVLLDLHMPGLDGMETAEAIRKGASGCDVPLIAVTAAAETVDEKRMRKAGFADMIAKPLSPAKLNAALDHARAFRRMRLALESGAT